MCYPRVLVINTSDTLSFSSPNLDVAGETRNVQQAIALTGQLAPDVIVLAVNALGLDDLHLIAHLTRRYPRIGLMIVSASDSVEPLALEAYRQGAHAYLLYAHCTLAEIAASIHFIGLGQSVLHPQIAGWIVDAIVEQTVLRVAE